jgi:hypothetical protein
MVLKPVYTVSELAELAGLSRFQMRRFLLREKLIEAGSKPRRKYTVTLPAFRETFPELWYGIVLVHELEDELLESA